MLKATISKPDVFRDSITTIGELIDEGIFKINKNGMELTAADRAMVALVNFKLPATLFDEFKVDEDQKIAINISNLVSILKRLKSDDKLILELKGNKLEITMENSSSRKFTLPLLEITQEELPPVDQLDFKAKVKLKSEVLKSGIEDADIVGDSVVFEANNERFALRAAGDITSAELILQKGNKNLVELSAIGVVTSRYPLEYLKKMVKASKLSEDVSIKWSKDYPIRMDFSTIDKVSLGFVLAPRVSED